MLGVQCLYVHGWIEYVGKTLCNQLHSYLHGNELYTELVYTAMHVVYTVNSYNGQEWEITITINTTLIQEALIRSTDLGIKTRRAASGSRLTQCKCS